MRDTNLCQTDSPQIDLITHLLGAIQEVREAVSTFAIAFRGRRRATIPLRRWRRTLDARPSLSGVGSKRGFFEQIVCQALDHAAAY